MIQMAVAGAFVLWAWSASAQFLPIGAGSKPPAVSCGAIFATACTSPLIVVMFP